MAFIKITDLAEETTPADGDLLALVDVSTNATKKVTRANLFKNPPLADTSITPAMLQAGAGSSWAWQSYTTSLNNVTIGSGTKPLYFIQIGKTIHFVFKFTYNSSTVSGLIGVNLPVAASSRYADGDIINAQVHIIDGGSVHYYGKAHLANTRARLDIYVDNASSTYLGRTATSATVPMTWANTDTLLIVGSYECA